MTATAQRLIGRDTEIEVLGGLLDDACAGASRFAVITGEPGIGKTSLLAELAQGAQARGCLVLEGRASELERELPFGLIVDALDAYLESLDARTFDRIAADELDELATVFPSLRALASTAGGTGTVEERYRAHRAVRALTERLAAGQPFVLTLDDLHWSDGASVELIRHLLRRPPEAAVLIAVGFRTARADPALVAAIEAAGGEGWVTRVTLGPLAADQAATLVDASPAERERLYRRSGGNPFYLLQLARSGTGGGPDADGDDDAVATLAPAGVPGAVAAAIATELADLSPPVRDFARAASVAGDPCELDLAVAAAAVAETDALAALDELIARDLLRSDEVPRRFGFRHPLVRSAVYATGAPGARMIAHERCADALAERGAAAIVRAHHVEQSARHGDAAALAVLREAGGAAAGRAPSSAARWFEAALRILPESAPSAERAELLMALAGSRAATGKLEGSHAALLQSLALAAGGPPGQRVAIISACAAVEQLLGRHEDADARLRAALAELPARDSPEGASLMIDLAISALYRTEYDAMRDWAASALAVAQALGDPPLTAAATGMLAFAETCTGPVDAAEDHRAQAAALVDAMPDEQLAVRLDAVAHLGGAEFYLDRFDEAGAHALRGLEVARATGQGHFFPMLTQALGNVLFATGRLAEAAETLDRAVDAARLTENPIVLAWSLLNRAYTALEAGEIEDAVRCGEESVALTNGLGGHVVGVWAGAICSMALLESGDPERAAELLVASGGGEDAPLVPGAWRATWLEWLTRCWLALGRRADAERAAARSQARADAFGLRAASASAARATAAVALHAGDAPTAAERALVSATLADEAGARVAAGISRTLAGRALARAGETDRAAAELERAAAELEACGARRYRDRAERELRALGRAVHRRTRRGQAGGGVASLSGRELEVARLVVDRRTNPEIAAELFLSVKTVETHMRNLFRKLDASSRVEVARAVERAEQAERAGHAT